MVINLVQNEVFIKTIIFVGVSSVKQLLSNVTLRYTAWINCFITCFGNALVIFSRYIFEDDRKELDIVIQGLAGNLKIIRDLRNYKMGCQFHLYSLIAMINTVFVTRIL